jgi:hypothetical protein
MIPLTRNNYIRQSGSGSDFKVEIDKLPVGGNYYEESVLAAEELYSIKEGNLHVLYSGGLDSEYVLSLFLELGMNITPVIIKLSEYNAHDIKYAFDFCQYRNVTPKIIDIDFDMFVKSGKLLEIATEARSSVYHRPATAYAASQLDGTVLLGDGEPYIRLNEETNTWNLEVDEHDYVVYNYLTSRGIPCAPHFNRYRAEMMSAYMLDPRMKELAEHKHPGKLGSNSSKTFMYNRHSPFKLAERQKYTGYEVIEQSEIFKHETFIQLENKYEGLVAFDYHSFVRDYINV